MSPGIGENDFNTKLKNGQKFLQGGDRLKVTIRFRGRQITRGDIGADVMEAFYKMVEASAQKERAPKQEGRNMFMVLSPKN